MNPLALGMAGSRYSAINQNPFPEGLDPVTSPIKEIPIPLPNSGPLSIASAPDGSLWIAEFTAGNIARLFPSNESFRHYIVPESHAQPTYVTLDSRGRVWFSDQAGNGSIWMLDPSSGVFTRHAIPTPFSYPVGVLIDGQNNVWFAEDTGGKLGELVYPEYSVVEYFLPTPGSGPAELALSREGSAIWLTESIGNRIGMFNTTTHTFREFAPTVPFASPVGIVLDDSNKVWVSEHGGSSIVSLDPTTGDFTKFPTSPLPPSANYASSAPATLVIDKQGRLWFVEHFSNKIGRLEPGTRTIEEFDVPSTGIYSVLSALDAAGNFWFTEFDGDRVGVVAANATMPVRVEALRSVGPSIAAGQTSSSEFAVTNEGTSPLTVQVGGTSTFFQSSVTSASAVSLNVTTLSLAPGQKSTVLATFTPDGGTYPGSYSVGVVARYGNASSVGIAVLGVTPNSTDVLLYQTLPDVLTFLNIFLFLANLWIWTKRKGGPGVQSSQLLLPLLCLPVLLLLLAPLAPPAVAKCPGLPGLGTSPSGPNYAGMVLDVVELGVTVILGYFLIQGLRAGRRRQRVGEGEPSQG